MPMGGRVASPGRGSLRAKFDRWEPDSWHLSRSRDCPGSSRVGRPGRTAWTRPSPAWERGHVVAAASDLLTDFKPYDRGTLEDAIDRFLAQFDDLGTELSRACGPTDLLTEIMAVAVALTTAKVGLRLFWRSRDDETALADADVCVNRDPFPGPLDL